MLTLKISIQFNYFYKYCGLKIHTSFCDGSINENIKIDII